MSARQSPSVNCVLVKNNILLSMICKSDAMSTACLLKDLMFSKVNTKVFGNLVNTFFWMNRPYCVDAHILE